MDDGFSETSLLRHLEDLAARLELEIRYEDLRDDEVPIHSGGCRLSGRTLVLIDVHLPPLERSRILARELCRYDLEDLYLLPRIREFIQLQGSPREKNLPQI
jgi:hypothetical protein